MSFDPRRALLAAAVLLAVMIPMTTSRVRGADFIRGDSNADGKVDISDATHALGCLFLGARCSDCLQAADSNDDGKGDISDAVYVLAYLFLGGSPPPPPFDSCGPDTTPDDLSCRAHDPCGAAPGDEPAGEGTSKLDGQSDAGQGSTPADVRTIRETRGEHGQLEVIVSATTTRDTKLVRVLVGAVEISSGAAWVPAADAPVEVGLRGPALTERLPPAKVAAGSYTGVRVILDGVELLADGVATPLAVPAELTASLAQPLDVAAGKESTLTLDLQLDLRVVALKASASAAAPRIRLRPAQMVAYDRLRTASREPVETRIESDTAVPRTLVGDWDPPSANPDSGALAFLREHASLYGIDMEKDGFEVEQVRGTKRGWTNVRLRQTVGGVPVHAGNLVVHFVKGRVRRVSGRFFPDIPTPEPARLQAAEAVRIAMGDLAARHRGIQFLREEEPPALRILAGDRHGRLRPDGARLVWSIALPTLSPAGKWRTFVDAYTGDIVDRDNEVEGVAPSRVYDAENTESSSDDTLWYEDEVKQETGTPPDDVALLDQYIPIFYEYLSTRFGVDSIDDAGMDMVGRAYDPAADGLNACWDCRSDQSIYLPGWVTLDVVGHEFTHGVVEKLGGGLGGEVTEAKTLNEAHADVFAELCDCWQSTCNWLVGTDHFGVSVPGDGVVRDVANPSVDHLNKYVWDNPTRYTNIGIPSKVAHLLAVGGTHYGVDVAPLGIAKTEQLLWATLIDGGLSTSATFAEYRDVMLQICREMIGGPEGITATDCRSVYRAWTAVGYSALSQPVVGALNESSDYFGHVVANGDFNGDGYRDLAVSAPYEDYDGESDTGAVFVFYGSSIGLQAGGAETLVQSDSGGVENSGDRYGAALAAGDFNGDGRDDLAIGTPGNNNSGQDNAGMVRVIYGSAAGLENGSQSPSWEAFSQSFANGAEEPGDEFGAVLAAGDFNGDGRDDLAVGSPSENLGTTADAGVVYAFYGGPSGLINNGNMSWEAFTQTLVEASNEAGDRFGSALAAGDFNGDGRDDLAVGVPREDVGSAGDTGVVNIVFGSAQGLIRNDNTMSWERLSQASVNATNEDGDLFGQALAAGDFNGDGRDDLAVGSPGEGLNGEDNAGMVTVLYGSGAGLYPPSWERFGQSFFNAAEEADDDFGSTLASGNLNGDGYDELLIGVPEENFAGYTNNGVVFIVWGSGSGLLPAVWQVYGQGYCGGDEADYDRFGFAVTAGDFDDNGRDDLAAGAPWEDFPDGVSNGGAVYVREY